MITGGKFKVLIGLLFLCFSCYSAGNSGNEILKSPLTIPDFSLIDHDGNAFGPRQLQDKWSMIFIGFTTCPDVCPYTLANLEAVRAHLGMQVMPENLPQIIFLAVDPERDQPVLKDYLTYFHGEFVGVTGQKAEIDKLVTGLGAFYRFDKKEIKPLTYGVVHSSAISVVNPRMQVVARLVPPFDPHKTATTLFRLIKGLEAHE